MQHSGLPPPAPVSGAFHDSNTGSPDLLAAADAVALLQLIGSLVPARNDPRGWRLELLAGLNQLLRTRIATALIIKNLPFDVGPPATAANAALSGSAAPRPREEKPLAPVVVALFDAGFQQPSERNSFLHEFNTAPLQDPLFRAALRHLATPAMQTFTALRRDLIDDATWNADPHLLAFRRTSYAGDCALSLQKSAEPGTAYALYVFQAPRRGDSPDAAGSPPLLQPRDRVVLDTLHRGLQWLYHAEESTHRLNRATGLPPRLRQTLTYLLAGDTERQVALKMSLSVHTVHDYVKAIYTHFGVSSRGALLANWMQATARPAKNPES